MNQLEKIVEVKYAEVASAKQLLSSKNLEKMANFSRPTISLSHSVRTAGMGVIAEMKRRSPSRGAINQQAKVEHVVPGYAHAGAAGISVLTDREFFGGGPEDLIAARSCVTIPILRKEFIIDQYQIIEARALGADAILLIAAILNPAVLKLFIGFAHSLNLEVLLEVHDKEELLVAIDCGADLIGVNNRNLKTFEVSLDTSRRLIDFIPASVPAVAESGIEDPLVVKELHALGYSGFLIGQRFMQTDDPGRSCGDFIRALKN